MDSSKLKKFTAQGGEWVEDKPSSFHVLHVRTPHLLLQAAGYLKHTLAVEKSVTVLFRGQEALHSTLLPSLYRGANTQYAKSSRDHALKKYLETIRQEESVLRAVPDYAREGLLQHYGIKTRYLDVVDNVWVALWFACHTARVAGRRKEFLHFERRRVVHHVGSASAATSHGQFAYILLVRAGAVPDENKRAGVFCGEGTELVDLRIAAPSQFLRPHAQHGLVVRRAKNNDFDHIDCADLVAGVIRVSLTDAFEWLGNGSLLAIHSLFPPAAYDSGYRELLENAPEAKPFLGAIHNVGA